MSRGVRYVRQRRMAIFGRYSFDGGFSSEVCIMFWVLHIVAVLLFPIALFLTIPLHLIFNKVGK